MTAAKLFDFLFPPICLSCSDDSLQTICPNCRENLAVDLAVSCPVCRRNLPPAILAGTHSLRCHPSASHLTLSAGSYENPVIRSLIRQLKFKRRADIAEILGNFLFRAVSAPELNLSEYVFVPIPLSPARLRSRGFNQAELIAEKFANNFGGKVSGALIRVKDSRPQSETPNWTDRRVNIAGVYQLARGADVRGKKIILIDDVLTSGATLSEATSVLRQAGAKDILALAVARA